jgi:hypothetical protein
MQTSNDQQAEDIKIVSLQKGEIHFQGALMQMIVVKDLTPLV